MTLSTSVAKGVKAYYLRSLREMFVPVEYLVKTSEGRVLFDVAPMMSDPKSKYSKCVAFHHFKHPMSKRFFTCHLAFTKSWIILRTRSHFQKQDQFWVSWDQSYVYMRRTTAPS
jgi:hypothetical protein